MSPSSFLAILLILLLPIPTAPNGIISDPCEAVNESVSVSIKSYSCPVKCFRAEPVCGDNGVTYWCGCRDARCAAARVVKLGFCEVGNNGAAAQLLLLIHILWLIVIGFLLLFGLF